MKLKYELPSEVKNLLPSSEQGLIWYAVPYDIADHGQIGEIGYVVVTKTYLYITEGKELKSEYSLDSLEDVRCESLVNNGILVLREQGEDRIGVRFSMKYLARYSYVARGIKLLSEKDYEMVVSKEKEKVCERCGRALPGTSVCPHCDGHMYTLKRFWGLCGGYQFRLLATSVFMILASVLNLMIPEVQKRFVDNVLKPKTGGAKEIATFLIVLLIFTMALLGANLLRNWWCATLGAGISMNLRDKLYHKIQVLSLSFIQKRKPGEIMNRVVRDTTNIRRFMEDIFSNMISTIIMMVGAFAAMCVMNPLLTVCTTILILCVFGINRIFRKKIDRIYHTQWLQEDRLSSSLQDTISGIRVVKSFGKEKSEAKKFEVKATDYAKIQKKNETFWAILFPILTYIMGVGIYLCTYFGGLRVLDERMTVGELMQFISYTGILYGPMSWMNNLPRMCRQMVTSLERIYDVLDEEPEITNQKGAKDLSIQGDVEFQHVSFGYLTYEPVLKDINLKVKKGEMIGLVGPSGAGKSTMINLIMRLYDIDQGSLKIDGIEMKELNINCLHNQIGVVLQETFLFSDTILNNIRFAKPDATYEEIILAAKAANAHDFIMNTPDGYNTYIGERGYTISGGERQRIAIARAILNDPKILILDEATSALDTESEYLIQQALNRLREGRTTFAIAHRLSTLREADRLVVIDGHQIAEVGTHDELIHAKGIYYGLVTAQLEMQQLEA